MALVVTNHARKRGLPLDPSQLVTEKQGQVLGLGKGAVQAILNRHGIARVLAAEGGRTSRGSMGNMQVYVEFLNSLNETSRLDLDAVEAFWIEQVKDFFAAKPFTMRTDSSKSLRSTIRNVLAQAKERQREAEGTQFVGAVIQHLVGAKLTCFLGKDEVTHHSFSTSDQQRGRAGDFLIEDVAIHVTTTPTDSVIARCQDNLHAGLRPIIVTLPKGVAAAEGLAEQINLEDRIDIFEVEQFIALNLYEFARFGPEQRKVAVADLVNAYNGIIDSVETDPSLKITFSA